MKLNGWQRIGIVLTALWVPGFVVWLQNERWESAHLLHRLQMDGCAILLDSGKDPMDFSQCVDNAGRLLAKQVEWDIGSLLGSAGFALVVALATWILLYGLVGVVRWVRAGFKRQAG